MLGKPNFPLRHPPRASPGGVRVRRAAWGGGKHLFSSSRRVPAPAVGNTEPPSSTPGDSSGRARNAGKRRTDAFMNGLFVSLSPGSPIFFFLIIFFSPSFFTPHLSSGPKQFSRYGSLQELWNCGCGSADLYPACRCFVKLGFFHDEISSFWEGRGQGTAFLS